MERDNEACEGTIDLGAATVETRGGVGAPIDERQQFLSTGLSDD